MAFFVNYSMMAELVLNEQVKRGRLKQPGKTELAARLDTYKEWLETYVVALLFEELETRRGVEGYVKILDASDKIRDRYLLQYLMQTIPNYEAFLRKAVTRAGNALLGNKEPDVYAPTEVAPIYTGMQKRNIETSQWTN